MKYLCANCENYPCDDSEVKLMYRCPGFKPIPKPMTNAAKIRAMTDEELAHWLEDHLCRAFCPDFNVDIDPVTKECLWNGGNCWMCILDWLKQGAERWWMP